MTGLLAADPLLSDGVDGAVLLTVLIKTVITFVVLLVGVLMMVWFERKLISDMQNRIGPNKAGPFGLLQTLADGIKLFFKEDLLPANADRRVFRLAPYLSAVPAFLSFAIVPIGGVIEVAGRETRLQLVDPPIGILFLLAMSAVAVYGVMLAGWASGSKYPLLGSVRASAQMISYEAALGLSIVAVVLIAESLTTSGIVERQATESWDIGSLSDWLGNIGQWNVVRTGVIPALVFLIAATAELNRPPFDLVEAEQELVGGYQTEYASIRFALFYLAEFMNTITMSAIVVTLFLGGPNGPNIETLSWLWPIVWFSLKLFAFLFFYVWLRATLPRFRYDQLMDLGWKKLIPVSLAWLLVIAGMLIDTPTGIIVFLGAAAGALMLWKSMRVGRARAQLEAQQGEAADREPVPALVVAGDSSSEGMNV